VPNGQRRRLQRFREGASSEDGVIKADDALIEFNPIMPGQTSPFHSLTTRNPVMSRFTVEFKHFFGESIPHRERSKRGS
jgi:hypothetical protein